MSWGWNTYYQITTELSPNEWIYENLTSYIITHRLLSSTDNIKFVQDNPCNIVKNLKQEQGKSNMDLWWCKYHLSFSAKPV